MGKLLKKKCHGGKMASGGTVSSGDPTMNYAEGGDVDSIDKWVSRQGNKPKISGVHTAVTKSDPGVSTAGAYVPGHGYGSNLETAKELHREKLSEMRSDKQDRRNLAEGGFIGSYQSPCHEDCNHPGMPHEEAEYMSGEYNKSHPMKSNSMAMSEDGRMLNQHGEEEEGPQGGYASGGFIGSYQDEAHMRDMVGHVMAQRQRMFSEGGKVANSDLPVADFKPNEFDDLHLRDDLEFNYTGKNSGDEDGDEEEDKRRRDMVSQVMKSRRK